MLAADNLIRFRGFFIFAQANKLVDPEKVGFSRPTTYLQMQV